jgi:hypothetical protein
MYVAALVVILEPWKGPGYIRRNTPFAVGAGTRAQGRKISYLVAVEDTDPTSKELQLEEFEYEPRLSRGRFQTDGRTDDRTMPAGATVT